MKHDEANTTMMNYYDEYDDGEQKGAGSKYEWCCDVHCTEI